MLNFEFPWSPDILSKTKFIWTARALRFSYAITMIPLHFILVVCESWLDWIPASVYDDHVVKAGWNRKQKLVYPIMKRLGASVASIGDPPAWIISSERNIPISTVIYIRLHDFFYSGPFVHVQQEDLLLSPSSKDWITGEAIDPKGQIQPVNVPLFWLHTQPASISKQGALLPQSCFSTVILYLVGGGYINGSPIEGPRCYDLARATGYRVMGVQYRKPSTPSMTINAFPAGLQDAVLAFAHLVELGYQRIIIAGDSAGGGLSVALMIYLAELSLSKKRPSSLILPAKLLLYSPWVDLTLSSLPTHSLDYLSKPMLEYAVKLYVPPIDPSIGNTTIPSTSPAILGAAHPLFSPALKTSLPRLRLITQAYEEKQRKLKILVTSGGQELLKEEIRLFVKNLREADLEVDEIVEPDALHVYQMLPVFLEPAAERSLMAVNRFLTEY